jgi:type IV secretory pathway VirB6-like protein
MRKVGLKTKLINAAGLLIAFNKEIGVTAGNFQSGRLITNPQAALGDVTYAAIGIDSNGNINNAALTASIVSKIGGYGFVKVAKFFTKHMRI